MKNFRNDTSYCEDTVGGIQEHSCGNFDCQLKALRSMKVSHFCPSPNKAWDYQLSLLEA